VRGRLVQRHIATAEPTDVILPCCVLYVLLIAPMGLYQPIPIEALPARSSSMRLVLLLSAQQYSQTRRLVTATQLGSPKCTASTTASALLALVLDVGRRLPGAASGDAVAKAVNFGLPVWLNGQNTSPSSSIEIQKYIFLLLTPDLRR